MAAARPRPARLLAASLGDCVWTDDRDERFAASLHTLIAGLQVMTRPIPARRPGLAGQKPGGETERLKVRSHQRVRRMLAVPLMTSLASWVSGRLWSRA